MIGESWETIKKKEHQWSLKQVCVWCHVVDLSPYQELGTVRDKIWWPCLYVKGPRFVSPVKPVAFLPNALYLLLCFKNLDLGVRRCRFSPKDSIHLKNTTPFSSGTKKHPQKKADQDPPSCENNPYSLDTNPKHKTWARLLSWSILRNASN